MSVTAALYEFLNGYAPLAGGTMHVNFLPADAGSYSLELMPSAQWVRRYVDGSGIRQVSFLLASRQAFDEDTRNQLTNLQFYERFSAWLTAQSKAGNLPLLEQGCTAQKIETVSCEYIFAQDKRTARYQIQCKMTYFQEKEC